jgi:hypothetical protein
LFKNAGTSVDAVLKANFPNGWATAEFSGPHAANLAQIKQWLQQENEAVAFSSHTAMLPPPIIDDVEIFPVLFIRHPIDRIASAYTFENKQGVNTFGSTVARHTSLAGYIEIHLSLGHISQCRNFQTARLAQFFNGAEGDISVLALQALDALPFVGLVEEFDQSIQHMANWLSPHFPNFKPIAARKNVTSDLSLPLEQKLEQIRVQIGDACYDQLITANLGDIALFEAVRKKYSF